MDSNNDQHKHEVVITAIVVKGGKFLITRRSANRNGVAEI